MDKEREKILIETGHYEKKYCENNSGINDRAEYDSNLKMYFVKKVIDVSDDEYEELKAKYYGKLDKSDVSFFAFFPFCIWTGGCFIGIILLISKVDFVPAIIVWCCTFVVGSISTMLYKIIELLANIYDKK